MKHTLKYIFEHLYLLIILLVIAMIVEITGEGVDYLWGFFPQYLRFSTTVIISGILSGYLGSKLPRRFNVEVFPFKCAKWEKDAKIYQRLFKINSWKDKLFDLSKAVNTIQTKTVQNKITSEQLAQLIQETCVAELTHSCLILIGLIFLFVLKKPWSIIFCLAYTLINLMFIMIQRFNRPRLFKAYHMLLKREKKERKK